MRSSSLAEIVAAKPFHDFADWWPVQSHFLAFMSNAICGEWHALMDDAADIQRVQSYASEYMQLVYQRSVDAKLVARFAAMGKPTSMGSGEFDTLSYAFYRAAFEQIARRSEATVVTERRRFTKRVGKRFFDQLDDHLGLDLPSQLAADQDLTQLQAAIDRVGAFLKTEGYLRTHFAFPLDVHVDHAGRQLSQERDQFLTRLRSNGLAYALYEMGYPVILPSAVYLYHTLGEAQHHSSRTIEELFARIGYDARETDDFDPIGYPSDRVVELWEIRPAA